MSRLGDTQILKSPIKDETKEIPLICSWCNQIYSISTWKVKKNQKTMVSHGICPECMKKYFDTQKGDKNKNAGND